MAETNAAKARATHAFEAQVKAADADLALAWGDRPVLLPAVVTGTVETIEAVEVGDGEHADAVDPLAEDGAGDPVLGQREHGARAAGEVQQMRRLWH